jgi:AcrR family transcriptional regulator
LARPTLNDDERAERRRQLLTAAHALFRATRELPSVAQIAESAGVAKGSVYNSFSTKEEIFVALLEDSFSGLLTQVIAIIATLPRNARVAARSFADGYAASVAQFPDLLALAGMTNAVLEKNLPIEAMLHFKTGLAAGLASAGAAVEEGGRKISRGDGADLLLHTWSLTLGLWQALDFPVEMRQQMVRPELAILDRDYLTELRAGVFALWHGALRA